MNHTRRSLLAGAASVGVVGAAGCLGGGGSDTGVLNLNPEAYDCDRSEPADPDLDYRPTLGNPDADVIVQAFEDFTCSHCATYSLEHFPTIREEYVESGDIRYEHWDFPIPVNEEWAVPVASAARGVGVRHGNEAFFEFAKAAYESQGSYGQGSSTDEMPGGANPCAVLADAQFATYEEASMNDRSEGEAMGVSGTPAIFVNGEAVADYRAETIAAAIDDGL